MMPQAFKKASLSTSFVVSLALFVVAQVGLLRLALWQHHRAAEKDALFAIANAQLGLPVVTEATTANHNRRITLTGTFYHPRSRVLAHQVKHEVAGYRLIT
ncbi:MAG: SURF1 family cytochrome oxidase biogenesis protein, partial [Alphaproteobacteria bacterium]